MSAVRDGGALAVVRRADERRSGPLVPERGITFTSGYVHAYDGRHDKLDRLSRRAQAGLLSLRVARTLPSRRAAEVHRLLEERGVRGRRVIEF